MTVYKNCSMTTLFYSDGDVDDKCEVNISEEKIVLSYFDEDFNGYIMYSGEVVGDGHYKLECIEVNGKGTLHRFPNGEILEGYWVEEGYEGMWRIKLKN